MNRLTRIVAAATLAAVSALAISQAPPAGGPPPAAGPGGPPSPEAQAKAAIETRQGLFKVIANQNGPIGGMNRPNAPAPDLALVARNAARLQTLAEIIPDVFTANTSAVTTVKTRALSGIWTSQADFKAKADALSKAAGTVATAAKSGDAAATKAAAAEMGKTCGGCHDTFRGPA
jgi:cytochrome c556